jgi:hypothetical protein
MEGARPAHPDNGGGMPPAPRTYMRPSHRPIRSTASCISDAEPA